MAGISDSKFPDVLFKTLDTLSARLTFQLPSPPEPPRFFPFQPPWMLVFFQHGVTFHAWSGLAFLFRFHTFSKALLKMSSLLGVFIHSYFIACEYVVF